MSKNIVILIDGTGNEVAANETNVFRLAGMLPKNSPAQIFHYDPGVGTQGLPVTDVLSLRVLAQVAGLAVGFGLYTRVANAYRYLMRVWQPGDKIFLFGFSRGAYAVRVLAGLIDKIGILEDGQESLITYALKLYADPKNVAVSSRFKNVLGRNVDEIAFLGLWDTVKSVYEIELSPPRLSAVALPRTRDNGAVRMVRHALAIDERRRFYRTNKWIPASKIGSTDVKQVWFAGVHSDIGGGYPEAGLSKIPLAWMIREASSAGLALDQPRVDDLIPPAAMASSGKP